MLPGNAGISSVISSLILTFIEEGNGEFSFSARFAAILAEKIPCKILTSGTPVSKKKERIKQKEMISDRGCGMVKNLEGVCHVLTGPASTRRHYFSWPI
ncbi:MAG TPA: hypothetical protein VJ882_00475 [Desulfuromonadales bacterium]|nr:hypothetical protein [Desulfuromonadales bacterium]